MTYPKRSRIGWTDYSAGAANFVIGCTPVSEGCANCYAADWAKRAGRDFSEVRVYHKKLNALLRWKPTPGNTPYRRGPGSKPMCFVVDLGDPFHDDVPFEFIARAWATMVHRDDIDFQVLTKRPARALELLSSYHFRGSVAAYVGRFRNPSADIWDPIITVLPWPPANIWIGVTAENQARADERIPMLMRIPAAVRFVSIEPMLGPVDILQYLNRDTNGVSDEKRGSSLRTGQGRDMEGRQGRQRLGARKGRVGPEKTPHPTGIPPSQKDAKRDAGQHRSTPAGMEALQRTHTRGCSDTPQKRDQGRQPTGKPRGGLPVTEHQGVTFPEAEESMGRSEPKRQADGCTDCRDQGGLCRRGEHAKSIGTEIRDEPLNNITDRARREAAQARRPGRGLYTPETTTESQAQPKGPIHLVIVGAESGSRRRPFDKAWAISVRDQCLSAGIPYFFKQSSARYPGYDPTLEGRTWQEWPEVAQ